MLKKFTGFVIFTALVLFLAPQAQALPNPSAGYCIEQGYESKVVDTGEGQHVVCVFPDGSECDQWDYFCKCTEKKAHCSSSMIEEGKNCKYPCKPQPCAKAGESPLVYECCEGLSIIPPTSIYDDECNQTGMTGWTSICSDCGNGSCESWENKCNCPKDCESTSKITTKPVTKVATKSATKAAKLDSESDQKYSYVYYSALAFLALVLLGLLILRFRKKIICRFLSDKNKTSDIK